jgi:hypothetical protein
MFQPVPPEQLPGVWEFVRHGLEVVIRRTGETWNPEDVRRSLVRGDTALFLRPDGFVVLERRTEFWSCAPYLNVWIAYFRPGKAKPLRAEFIAWLDSMRALTKTEWLEFRSPREGWAGLEPDFVKVATIWRRK